MKTPRSACAFIPHFHAVLRERDDPKLRGVPFAVAAELKDRDRISALSASARAAGVRDGMTTVQALAVCSSLTLLVAQPGLEQQATDDAIFALRTVSPGIEAAGDGFFYVDPRGLEHLHGGEGAIARHMAEVLTNAGFGDARAAIAGTRFCAFAAVMAASDSAVVPPGQDRGMLAPLSLELLPLSQDALKRLFALGLSTIGEFAALPAPSIEVRYGHEGVRAHRLARGLDDDPLVRTPETETIEEHMQLPGRACDLVVLEPVFDELLDRVLNRMATRGVLALAALFTLDDDTLVEISAEPASPCTDRKMLRTLLLLELERLRFPAPVVEVTLRVLAAAPPLTEQASLFQRRRVDPVRMQRVLSHLAAMFGKDALRRVEVRDAVRPEAATRGGDFRADARQKAATRAASASVMALRLFAPPRPVRTSFRDARLASFTAAFANRGFSLKVRFALGPTRLSGEWWERPFERDYFTVGTVDRGLYWLFRDRVSGRWYLHGVFD